MKQLIFVFMVLLVLIGCGEKAMESVKKETPLQIPSPSEKKEEKPSVPPPLEKQAATEKETTVMSEPEKKEELSDADIEPKEEVVLDEQVSSLAEETEPDFGDIV